MVARLRLALSPNLWMRLAVLVLLAALPPLCLLIGTTLENRRSALEEARAAVLSAALRDAALGRAALASGRELLGAITLIPEVAAGRPGCAALLRGLAVAHAGISMIAVVGPDGRTVCDSRADGAPIDVSDRVWLAEARRDPGRTVSGPVQRSRATGVPVQVVARALTAPDGIERVVTLGERVDWFAGSATTMPGPRGRFALVIDAGNGEVLSYHGPGTAPRALPAGDALLRTVRRGGRSGTVESSFTGQRAVFGFARLLDEGQGAVLAIGVPAAPVLAAANRMLALGLLTALLVAVASLGTAWLLGKRVLLDPMRALILQARRFGRGALEARVEMPPHTAPELNQLRRSLIAMAESLERSRGALARSEQLHRMLAENATDVILRFGSNFRLEYVSPSAAEVLGYPPAAFETTDLLAPVHDDDRYTVAHAMRAAFRTQAQQRVCFRWRRPDATLVWLEAVGRPFTDSLGGVAILRDVTERVEAEQQLQQLATLDPLTGLPNRRSFDTMLASEWRRGLRTGTASGLLLVDVDHFKAFNDRYGHPAGDACLQRVATALAGALRQPGDFIARIGGEEFAVILPATGLEDAAETADALVRAVRGLAIRNGEADITVSCGAAVRPAAVLDGDVADLVAAADRALYAAKASGRNQMRCIGFLAHCAAACTFVPDACAAADPGPAVPGSAGAESGMHERV